jgi:hypothetical protein
MKTDAAKKIPGEGFKRVWPPLIKMDESVKAKIDALFNPARQRVSDVHSNPSRVLEKQNSTGHDLIVIDWQSHQEFHLTLRPLPGEKLTGTVRRLAAILRDKNASIVRQEIFGSLAAHTET